MKKENFKIGGVYEHDRDSSVRFKLENFDSEGDPVLLPLPGNSVWFVRYTEKESLIDPLKKEGYVGITFSTFLNNFHLNDDLRDGKPDLDTEANDNKRDVTNHVCPNCGSCNTSVVEIFCLDCEEYHSYS